MHCPKINLPWRLPHGAGPCEDLCCVALRLAERVSAACGRLRGRRAEWTLTALSLAGLACGWLWQGTITGLVAYGVAYVAGGFFGVLGAVRAMRRGQVDIDLLMVVAALAAAAIGAPLEGALLLFLFSLSNTLQGYALERTRGAIEALGRLRPERVQVRRDGFWEAVAPEAIRAGDLMRLRPGERVAVDAAVVEGTASVDLSSITGEALPVRLGPGDEIPGGAVNCSGSLRLQALRPEGASAVARLIRLVEEARAQKAPTERFMERAERYYAAGVLGATGLAALLPPLLWGEASSVALYRAITLMVAASPCALVISTPATVLAALGGGARRGLLFKGGAHLEGIGGIDIVVFDKTGTLTGGRPQVVAVYPEAGWNEDAVLALAAVAESPSEHPLARALVEEAERRGLAVGTPEHFEAETGRGIRARVGGTDVWVGRPSAVRQEGSGFSLVEVRAGRGARLGAVGRIAMADRCRPGAAAALRRLRHRGVKEIVVLSGDCADAVEEVARQVGADACYSGLLPAEKVEYIRRMRRRGKVLMVGDGVNDAPALAAADLGAAMGGTGTDAARESADLVLMGDDLNRLADALVLGRRVRRTLAVNLGIALGAMALMVGAVLGWGMALPLAVLGHEGGTVLVSLNGVRLLAFRGR